MSLDELPPLVEHQRLRSHYRDDTHEHQQWLEEQDIAEHEMSGGAWDGVMAACPEHRSRETWSSNTVDRRLHDRAAAVADGLVRDDDPEPMPWSAA